MIHSHNSYWCNKPIIDSVKKDAKIFEADIVWHKNDLYLSHSWRPCKKLMYGTLEEVYLKPLQILLIDKTITFYLYIELKSGNLLIRKKLADLLIKYNLDNLIILLDAKDRNWYTKKFQKRERLLYSFVKEYKDKINFKLWDYFKINNFIERKDFYNKSLNHF